MVANEQERQPWKTPWDWQPCLQSEMSVTSCDFHEHGGQSTLC